MAIMKFEKFLPRAASVMSVTSFVSCTASRKRGTGAHSFVSLLIISAVPTPQLGWQPQESEPHCDSCPFTMSENPDFVREHVCGILGHGEGAGVAMGLALLRLPSQLRRGHGADDQQGDEGMGSRSALPRCRTTYKRRHRHYRCGPRQEFLQLHDGHGALEELQAFPGPQGAEVV